MKHRFMPVLPVVVLILTFSGCINYEQKTRVNADGSGSMEVHYWTKESVVGWLSGEKLVFNEGELQAQYESIGIHIDEARVEGRTEDSTRHVFVNLAFDDINKLSDAKGFKGSKYSWKQDGENIVFSQILEANSSANGLGLDEFTVTYTYEFPGDVLSSNATKVDGTTLTWTYTLPELSKEVMLTATIRTATMGNLTTIILIVGGAVLLVIILLLVFRRKG